MTYGQQPKQNSLPEYWEIELKKAREMSANKQFDFYNPDSMYYANSKHYIAQLEAMSRQQQAEIEALKQIIDANNLNQNIGQFRKAQEK